MCEIRCLECPCEGIGGLCYRVGETVGQSASKGRVAESKDSLLYDDTQMVK